MRPLSYLLNVIAILFLGNTAIAQPTTVDTARLYKAYEQEMAGYEAMHGHYITTQNVKMHYMTWGKPSGIPFVWVHGTHGNTYEMYGIADSIVKHGYYVIAIDFYAHGLTPIPKKEVSLYHVADDIKYLLEASKIKKAILGGFSRGGSIVTAFYSCYPNYVKALVLEDGGSVAWDVNTHKKSVDSLINEFKNNYKDRKPPARYTSRQEFFIRLYHNAGNKPNFKRTAFMCLNMIKLDTDGMWTWAPGLNDLVCENTADQLIMAVLRPYAANNLFGASTHLIYPKIIYRNLNVPMLIFDPVSKEDWFDFEEENNKLAEAHPGLIIHKVYQNTGHAVKTERPMEFTTDLITFLSTIKNK